jgi:hypothetical protein
MSLLYYDNKISAIFSANFLVFSICEMESRTFPVDECIQEGANTLKPSLLNFFMMSLATLPANITSILVWKATESSPEKPFGIRLLNLIMASFAFHQVEKKLSGLNRFDSLRIGPHRSVRCFLFKYKG